MSDGCIETYSIQVQRTARVYTLGSLDVQTENIWLVLHGYNMLAKYFIQKFEELDLSKNFIIAPEGLSRSYLDGFSGRVGASWMTSEDRENEIKDQVNFLDQVYQKFITPDFAHKNIIAFGFSQGVATVSRWANLQHCKVDQLIAWAGTIPKDVIDDFYMANIPISIYYGDQDEFLDESKISAYFDGLHSNNIPFRSVKFSGGHHVDKDVVKEIVAE